MTTTTKSLTEQQIDNLRRESAQAGDFAMTAICSLASTGEFDADDWTTLERADARRISAMSQDAAIAEVVAAINAAEAMRTTYRIVTVSGRGLPTTVDADGYDTREAADAMAANEHDGDYKIEAVKQ